MDMVDGKAPLLPACFEHFTCKRYGYSAFIGQSCPVQILHGLDQCSHTSIMVFQKVLLNISRQTEPECITVKIDDPQFVIVFQR